MDITKFSAMLILLTCLLFVGCSSKNAPEPDPVILNKPTGIAIEIDSATYNLGIPLYTADQGKKGWTEFNTELTWFKAGQAITLFQREYFNENPYLICIPEGSAGSFGVRMSLFKSLFNRQTIPSEMANKVTGVRFNAVGFEDDELKVLVLDINENILAEQVFELEKMKFKSYDMDFQATMAKELVFFSSTSGSTDSVKFGIDDVYLKTSDAEPFTPPAGDEAFLAWLKHASFNFFDWNYVEVSEGRGVVLESYTHTDKISLSGMGYAYPIFILAGEDGYITRDVAKTRVKSMLQWQVDQNWFDGSGGWHGIPHHYFRKDGSALWPDVSTIDWAICAAGIRVAKEYFADDTEIVIMAEELLQRADWTKALAADDKIAMGFDGSTGVMNDYRWALAFSEETEIVYLEAVASGYLDASVFDAIIRDEQNGFYPSWFAAGFTYNWLQLWTGAIEPYKSNAVAAYDVDASTCLDKFGIPVMGLTACTTVSDADPDGFLNWNQYISNQGGQIRLTGGSVIQISPAPYGAALGLPFTYEKSMTALREFVNQGYYHEYLGLPDNVRMRKLPDGFLPAPNWDPFDINIGPLILAIEQIQQNRVPDYYLSDQDVSVSLDGLIGSFPE